MVSLRRILTKLLLPDERGGTLIFFLVSAGLELLCFLLHLLVRGSRFVLYHTARPRCGRRGRAGYRVHHDVGAEDVRFVSTRPTPWAARCQRRLRLLLWPEIPSSILWLKVSCLGGTTRLYPEPHWLGWNPVCGLKPTGPHLWPEPRPGGQRALWWRYGHMASIGPRNGRCGCLRAPGGGGAGKLGHEERREEPERSQRRSSSESPSLGAWLGTLL